MVNPIDPNGDPTEPTLEGGQVPQDSGGISVPEFLGRYRIEKVIAKGGYGIIYRAWDENLKRSVAVKVLNSDSLRPETHQSFLEEARIVAGLDHPNIVPVYDIGQSESGSFYIVSRLIDGSDLNKRMQLYPVSRRHALQIVAEIADALNYAHSKGLVHRDVKPANILIDAKGRSYLTDFGIALREQSFGDGCRFIGTPEYMSPEQIRGESHRVDHRSDIFSLGLILYRLLTGRGPFAADSDEKLMEMISTEDVRTPRVFDETISVEIERVCLKALARRPHDRYSVANDFADDIRWILASKDTPVDLDQRTPLTPRDPVRSARPTSNLSSPKTMAARPAEQGMISVADVVPKGLRSYDEKDSDFFLQLLPGPYDRRGVPEVVRSWINRLSSRDKGTPMALAIYGPSGCGKSSLIKAGVLPRLTGDFVCICLEAMPGKTELNLKQELVALFPDAVGNSLTEILASIRRDLLIPNHGKLLIVIDQFEQWLANCDDYAKAELTESIRQCDGYNIQAIFTIRDDFWVPLNRFFKELEIPLVDGQNCELVDLFSKAHAKKVLGLFGIALGKLSSTESQWTDQQRQFLERSAEILGEDGKIVPVKLSLYVDTIKSREWNLACLKEVGGIEGVGMSFLNDSFNSKYSKPENRRHAHAAEAFLSQLLPPRGSEIKGVFKPVSELKRACGYEDKPEEFNDLVNILDRKLRLITAVSENRLVGTSPEQVVYQLTHDYLVPSLREWVGRNKRSTPKGRAELVLDECARVWIDRKEDKQLPTFLETIAIFFRTNRRNWTQSQAQMMRAATWHHGERLVFLLTYLTVFMVIGLIVRQAWIEQNRLSRIQERIRQVMSIDPNMLEGAIEDPTWTPSVIKTHITPIYSTDANSKRTQVEQLHAKIIAAKTDKTLVLPLREELLSTDDVRYIKPLSKVLSPHSEDLDDDLLKLFTDTTAVPKRRFHAAIFLLECTKMRIAEDWNDQHFAFIAEQLLLANSEQQPMLRELLRPIASKLLPHIERSFTDQSNPRAQESAANAFKDYCRDDSVKISDLIALSNTRQFELLFPLIKNDSSRSVVGNLSSITSNMADLRDADIDRRIQLGKRRACASIALILLGEHDKVSPLFYSTENPEAISQFIHLAKKHGVSGLDLLTCINTMRAFTENTTALYTFLSIMGDYRIDDFPAQEREPLIQRISELYREHPESKIHSIAYWLLKKWDFHSVVEEFETKTIPYSPSREWFQIVIELPLPTILASDSKKTKSFCYTFLVFQPGQYELGSRELDDPDRQKDEDVYISYITHPFAVMDREVTFEEILCFSYQPFASEMHKFDVQMDAAAFCTTWFDSVAFCRWLALQAGISDQQQAYPDHRTLDSDQYPRDQQTDWAPLNWPIDITQPGFRLPMEAEWEIVARGNSKARFSFGADMELLKYYAWFDQNSNRRVHAPRELRPNMRGVFDAQGNVFEWCHGWTYEQRQPIEDNPVGPKIGSTRVDRGGGWYYGATQCRPTFKYGDDPSLRGHNLGFRIAITLDPAWTELTKRKETRVIKE
jgi:serine/threonine protein kinase/formylglycine-generating enzyme required for sulfatase activity